MKPARRRIDVNLDELDRVLDGARQEPLSEADYDKLKGALHALAAMMVQPRHTEKTSAVLEEEGSETSARTQPDINAPPPPGHGRNPAEAFGGARKVDIAHQKLKHGMQLIGATARDDRHVTHLPVLRVIVHGNHFELSDHLGGRDPHLESV